MDNKKIIANLIRLLSVAIGLLLCVAIVVNVLRQHELFTFTTLDLIAFLVGISFLLGLPTILVEATSIKFMEFEVKRELKVVQRNLRQYAVLDSKGKVIKTTFPSDEMRIVDFELSGPKLTIWMRHEPIYLEIRSTDRVGAYKVQRESKGNGVTFIISLEGSIEIDTIYRNFIIEAYLDNPG